MNKEKAIEVCKLIAKDIGNDASEFDGKMNRRSILKLLWLPLASLAPIKALANFKARHIGVVKGFVVLENLYESGTLTPNKLRWSGDENA